MSSQQLRVAVDIGGTFVDAVELDARTGTMRLRKAPTTPARPWEGVEAAVDALGTQLADVERFIHGTTLGLNAVLERRGATVGIITNEGLRDIFVIGRANVPDADMYNAQYAPPPPLVHRRHCRGVRGRLDAHGRELEPLDEAGVLAAADELVAAGVQAIAICLLHSYRDPAHEQRAAQLVREKHPDIPVSVSSDIRREYREFERTSTTVLDAYIRPVFGQYVERLEESVARRGFDGRFLIMRSGGGALTAAQARHSPTDTILSGPAGGIVGAAVVAETLGREELLTFDVGGTSLDTCVIDGGAAVTVHETVFERYPLLVPVYDIRTIGAGGGSIAGVDHGLLKVGPRSAGAEPGPICYRRGGTEPTVTDAAVCLGYVDPDRFNAGGMSLDAEGARRGIVEQVAEPLGLGEREAAAAVFKVLLAHTVAAVREITVERGRDPQRFSVLAFGGAGPLLAPLLGREMGIREVIIPNGPSVFSAWGMLSAQVTHDVSRTLLRPLEEIGAEGLAAQFAELERDAVAALADGQSDGGEAALLERQLDLRYQGQEHALSLTVGASLEPAAIRAAFATQHESRYGHVMDNPVEVLTVRVRAIERSTDVALAAAPAPAGDESPRDRALLGTRAAWCFARNEAVEMEVYERARLCRGDELAGPVIVDEGTSTTVIDSTQRLRVDDYGHLIITDAEATR